MGAFSDWWTSLPNVVVSTYTTARTTSRRRQQNSQYAYFLWFNTMIKHNRKLICEAPTGQRQCAYTAVALRVLQTSLLTVDLICRFWCRDYITWCPATVLCVVTILAADARVKYQIVTCNSVSSVANKAVNITHKSGSSKIHNTHQVTWHNHQQTKPDSSLLVNSNTVMLCYCCCC